MDQDRKNYLFFLLDGGFFTAGMSFVNTQTLLPGIVLSEGGPSWLAAFLPSAMVIPMFGIPVFVASLTESLPRLKPFVLKVGFYQRMIYIIAGLLLLSPFVDRSWLIWIVSLAPLLTGIFGGIVFTAFQRMYIASVPTRMRASNLAFRSVVGGVTGVFAGRMIEWLLTDFDTMFALGVLHLITAFFFILSLWAISRVPEPLKTPMPAPEQGGTRAPFFTRTPFWGGAEATRKPEKADVLRGIRDLLAPGDARKSRLCFAASVILMHGFFISMPFFASHLKETLGMPPSFLGVLAIFQMIGNASGNLLAAWIGDRFGGRFTFITGAFAFAATILLAPLADSKGMACALYGLNSLALMILIVGKDTLSLDIGPKERQSHYLSAMALLTMAGVLVFSLVSYTLWSIAHSFTLLSFVAAFALLLCAGMLLFVTEPREDVRVSPLARIQRGFLRYFR